MIGHRNIPFIFIGANTAYTSATSVNNIADGEVAFVTAGGTVITTSNDALNQKFRIVQGRGAGLSARSSDLIDPTKIVTNSIHFDTYVAPTQQVTTIGYNGTSGSLDAQNSNEYLLRVNLLEESKTGFAQQKTLYGAYTSDVSATQEEIANNLTINMVDNLQKLYEKPVKIERICDEAGEALGTGVDDVVFTNGSTTISATDIDDATTNTVLAVGDFIRIGTGTTGPVYKIVSIDATNNTAELDVPYQGATATIADTGLERIDETDAAAAEWGLVITGIQRDITFAANKAGDWNMVRFDTQLKGFGDTIRTATATPNPGFGNYQQVAKEEWMAESVYGNRYTRDTLHPRTVDTDLTGATYYACHSFRYVDDHFVTGVGPQPSSHKQVRIWLGDGSSSWSESGTQAATIQDVFNTITGGSYAWAAPGA